MVSTYGADGLLCIAFSIVSSMLTVTLGEVPETYPPELVRRWPMLRLRLFERLLGRLGLKRGCIGMSIGTGAGLVYWPSGIGTDIDRPILSVSP